MEETTKSNLVRDAIATVDVDKYNINIFDAVYDKIKAMIANKQFNAGNWITLLMMCMELVEAVPHLTGKEKRSLVVDLLTKLVAEIPMAESDRALIQGLLSSALPAIIDAICDSSLGVYAINLANQAQEHVTGCINKCVGGSQAKSRRRATHRRK